ncbi:MAG: AraC family transcriptional regulator [Sphingomonadales bacterium]|nr:AraC family transcriptional regulator [Sphingomonadales bacterium]
MSATCLSPDRRSRPQDDPIIRVGCLEGYRTLLLEFGHDPQLALQTAGIEPSLLNYPDRTISVLAYRRALNIAAEITGTRHFGLLLSQRQTFEKLGAVGYLVRHAPDLRTSIERLILHFRTHDTGSMTRLEVDGAYAYWRHGLEAVVNDSAVQQTELAIGLACKFLRSALGETWNPLAIYFEHVAPRDTQPFRAVFRCPVHFGQTLTALEFPRTDLDRPLRQSDAGLFHILEQHVERIEEGLGNDLCGKVRQIIQQKIESGVYRLDEVAASLGLQRHALQRRLKAEGANFQQLRDDVRFEIGCRHLRETDTPISEIAGMLGYAETAVFTRAFARRAGQSPRAWRQAAAR